MWERQSNSVEHVAAVTGERAALGVGNATWPVQGVAGEWVAGGGEVDANLMRAAGLDLDADDTGAFIPLQGVHDCP